MVSLEEDSNVVLIAGPTASGKSALALELAQATGGVIINTDSMQVYRDLRVITARPTPEQEALVPHRLYGHIDAAVNFSAGSWVADAAKVLAEARAQNRPAIFVGGSGLYFKALTRGLWRCHRFHPRCATRCAPRCGSALRPGAPPPCMRSSRASIRPWRSG